MKKKRYEGILDEVPRFEICLNVNKLQKGKYMLKIMNRNKIIKNTHFSKEWLHDKTQAFNWTINYNLRNENLFIY